MIRVFKKYKIEILLSLLLTTFIMLPYFKEGIYISHDICFHMSRFEGIISSITDGQFPLAIYTNKNFGLGYASPLFYCDLFLIVPSFLVNKFNINFVTMYKMIVGFFVLLTNLNTTISIRYLTRNSLAAVFGAFVLVTSNYYLGDLFMRAALGEIMAIAFLPSLFILIYKFFFEDKNRTTCVLLGLNFACVLLCHNITFFLACVAFAFMLIFNLKRIIKDKKFGGLFLAILVGSVLSAFFIFPMIEQISGQTFRFQMVKGTIESTAVPFSNLFDDIALQFSFSFNNTNGLFEMDKYKNIGIIVLLLPTVYCFAREKNAYINQILFIGLFFVLLSLKGIPLSKIEFLESIQFPSRFYIVATVLLIFVSCWAVSKIKCNHLIIAIVTLFSLFNCSFLYVNLLSNEELDFIDENATYKEIYLDGKYDEEGLATFDVNYIELENAEYLPYYFGNYQTVPIYPYDKNYQCVDETFFHDGTKFVFTLDKDASGKITIPATYYYGYKVYEVVQGEYIEQDSDTNDIGLLTFEAKNDGMEHEYVVLYKNTRIQIISSIISIIGASVLAVLCLYDIKYKGRKI